MVSLSTSTLGVVRIHRTLQRMSSSDLLTGSVDLMHWKCLIPGKSATPWEKGLFPLELEFTEAYPSKPPDCRFPKGFFHPNGGNSCSLRIPYQDHKHIQQSQGCDYVCSVSIWKSMSLHCKRRAWVEACNYCKTGNSPEDTVCKAKSLLACFVEY